MEIQNEISVDNFHAISRFAAGAGGNKVRSRQDDRWLRSTGPAAYQSVYDPCLGRIATSWLEFRPGLIMFYGEARPHEPLTFPVRASQDTGGVFISSRLEANFPGVGPGAGSDFAGPLIFPSHISKGEETRLSIGSGVPTCFFGIFGPHRALIRELPTIRQLMARYDHLGEDSVRRGVPGRPEVTTLLLQMLKNPFHGEVQKGYLQAKALEILSVCCHYAEASEHPPRHHLDATPVQFICAEVNRSPGADLSLNDFARYLEMSERTLSREFREATGMTFSTYRRRKRMELAGRLLASGSATTKRVCFEVGYSAITAFFRAFRDHHGMTPDEYRRNVLR